MTTHEYSIDTYPYRHAGRALELQIEDCQVDGDEYEVEDPSQIKLFEREDWSTVTFKVALSVALDTLDYVFPSVGDHSGALVMEGYCPSTHGRFAEPIEHGDFGPGTHIGEIELDRQDFRGVATMVPRLLRGDSRSADDEYASQSGRYLAEGPRCDIYFDRPKLSLSGDLPVVPAKFSEPDNPGEPGTEWYVDVRDAETPRLYLNRDYPTVVNAINSIENPTKQGIVGRVVLNHLSVSMLTQFTIKAASHAVAQDEIQYEWQDTLLNDLCSEYFTEGTVEEMKESLQIEAISDTVSKIETIYQRRRAPQEDVKRLLEMMSS